MPTSTSSDVNEKGNSRIHWWPFSFFRGWLVEYDYEAAETRSIGDEIPSNESSSQKDDGESFHHPNGYSYDSLVGEVPTVRKKRNRYLSSWFHRLLSGITFLLGLTLAAAALLAIAWRYQYDDTTIPYIGGYPQGPVLRFRRDEDGPFVFKVVQITDIHLGEAEDLDWGPRHDRQTWEVLNTVLTEEDQVDLIVLGGDQLTANNCKDNATAYYRELGEFLSNYGIPWALIFGNHDDMDFETRKDTKIPAKYLRQDLLPIDQSFPLSLTQGGPSDINGTTNYVLDVYGPADGEGEKTTVSIAAQIFLLDSGGGSIQEAISDSQVDWVQDQASKSPVPAVAFQHIPTVSHAFVEGTCQGLHDDGVAPLAYDGGILEALSETEKFFFLAVGHNHGNDYCCPYQGNMSMTISDGLHVCFGRHSGYGGYGHWDRGSRVYQLEYSLSSSQVGKSNIRENTGMTQEPVIEGDVSMRWSSWVRLESGEVIDRITRH